VILAVDLKIPAQNPERFSEWVCVRSRIGQFTLNLVNGLLARLIEKSLHNTRYTNKRPDMHNLALSYHGLVP